MLLETLGFWIDARYLSQLPEQRSPGAFGREPVASPLYPENKLMASET